MNKSKHAIDVLGAYLTQSLHARRRENVEVTIRIPGHMNTFVPNSIVVHFMLFNATKTFAMILLNLHDGFANIFLLFWL